MFLDPVMAWVELEIITTEEFNSLPAGEQGMTEEEYDLYTGHLIRFLQNDLYFHYIYAHDAKDDEEPDSLQGIAVKGRIPRSAGDNLTRSKPYCLLSI